VENTRSKINIDKGLETKGQNRVLMEFREVLGEDLGRDTIDTTDFLIV